MTRSNNPRWRITTDSLAAIAVTLLPLIYFFPATRGHLIISPDDGVIFNIPMRVAVSNLLHAGELPLWNPYMFSGMPLFGAAQAGVLFPLNWFYLIFSIPVATNLMMLATYMLAALGAFLYARRSGASIAGAVATSMIWQWSAFMVAKVGQTNVVQTAALLPWVLWAIDRYAQKGHVAGQRKAGLVLALLVTLQLFAGHQQTFAYSLLLAGAYALVMARTSEGSERRSYLWSLVFLGVGVIASAVQLLPTIELLRHSLRATASYDFFSSFSMPPRFLLTIFAPFIMGGGDGQLFRAPYIGPAFVGEYIAYVGALTIMLALLALFLKPDARTKFWWGVVVVCLALAIGRFLPLNVYKLIYYVPVLNLFRVPARHLMEVEFALAVLAGRGLAAIVSVPNRARLLRAAAVAGGLVFLLTCLTVSWWRPADFKLGRLGPVTILRAPELFIPILIAALSAVALWYFVRNRERRFAKGLAFLLGVLVLDVCLWGQFSGWRLSPTRAHPLWSEPESVRMLRNLERDRGNTPYRILTDVQPFFINTGRDEEEKYKLGEFMLSLQPDTYVMHGIENAAGYDGFGLSRYSKLAGDMKLWGELTDPERSVRGPGREFDILNVRYLLKQSPYGEARRRAAERGGALAPAPPPSPSPASLVLGGFPFAKEELGAPSLVNGERLVFAIPPVETNAIALVTSLSWSADVKDGEAVAQVRLLTDDGKRFEFPLLAGEHTSEWSHDRPDLKNKIRHRRAPVATSSPVADPSGDFESHTYVCKFSLPETVKVTSGEIEIAKINGMPNLTLDVKRVSLLKDGSAEPLRGDWVDKLPASESKSDSTTESAMSFGAGRWRLATENSYLQIYENTRSLPRAWLAIEERAMTEEEELQVIRTGKLPGGQVWDPLQTALVEAQTLSVFGASMIRGTAEVTRHEPNRIEVKTDSVAPAILVLSENHYPGWRAYVDEKSVEVIRVDYNLRGVAVPAGKHLVKFVYQPKSVIIGLAISLLALVGLLLWALRLDARFRRKRAIV